MSNEQFTLHSYIKDSNQRQRQTITYFISKHLYKDTKYDTSLH